MHIEVQELTVDDINFVADYWLTAEKDFLLAMGVDLCKLPTKDGLEKMLTDQINTPYPEKSSLTMILKVNGQPSGHCNVNEIKYGYEAKMHLHLWKPNIRKKGLGTTMVLKSLPKFFDKLDLKVIYCEPNTHNQAPNRTLEKVGFEFVKRYVTVPGPLNFEQEVNRYKLTKAKLEEIKNIQQQGV
ncbi:GNAT family protein [Ascidiimonas aurantiaca]|uniref:GNAT family N-acetyltransferase n=1 Tax=Ascidiimonas aurantiaca TaxID=1685432 RepID=UPI0030ED53F3